MDIRRLEKWKDRPEIVTGSYLPKGICTFNAALIETNRIFLGTEKLILTFTQKNETYKNVRKTLKNNKNWVGGREVSITNWLTIELGRFSIGHEWTNPCRKITLKYSQ